MNYKYDVAFSFCNEDLSYAYELERHLNPCITSFVYADKQEALAGRDGPAKFANVFAKESRLVVIIYRGGYGVSGYTAVEKDAIVGRALKQGWDFVLVIPFERPIPVWYPYTKIYQDPTQYQTDQIAATIEYKLRELGFEPIPLTLDDKAVKIQKQDAFNRERIDFLHSNEAFETCKELFEDFWSLLPQRISILAEHIDIRFQSNSTVFKRFRQVYRFHRVNNKAHDSYLLVSTEKVDQWGIETQVLQTERVEFDINESKILHWKYGDNLINSATLVDKFLDILMSQE